VTVPQTVPAPSTTTPRSIYDLVVALFCGLLLISNVSATKLIQFGPSWEVNGFPVLPIITDGGAFLFPLTYILGDILAEVYGLKKAHRAIWAGFALAFLMSITFAVVAAAPPADGWPNNDAWNAVLGFVPRIVVASLAGYLAGQFLNALVLVKIRERFGTKRLWVRLIGSTIVGEFADTLVFCLIAFGPLGAFMGGGSIDLGPLVNYIVVGFVYKVTIEVVFLPVTYRVIPWVRRREGLELEPPVHR
jgi:uncharacterized integral membrane protein (TIGR00697 family)